MHLLAVLTREGWRPGIGDPNLTGWLTVVCYLATAGLCLWAGRVARVGAAESRRHRLTERRATCRISAYRASCRLWGLLVLAFIFLGINKQLDLQTWLTELGRRIALDQGWYMQRREVQAWFVCGLAGLGLATFAILVIRTRHLLPRHVLALVGIVLLTCFVLARASSFHHLDDLFRHPVLGIKIRWLLEFAGIFCVGLCAMVNCRWYLRRRAAHVFAA